jgi:hypothetical protein
VLVAAVDLVASLVEHDVGEAQHVPGERAARPAQDRLRACDDLGEAERLRDVVVSTRAQRLDLVLGRVLRRQEEDRGAVAVRAQAAAHLDPLDVGEHPVEDDQVGLAAADRVERGAARGRLLDVEALVAEGRRDRVDDRGLVVDDEDPLSAGGHENMVAAAAVKPL